LFIDLSPFNYLENQGFSGTLVKHPGKSSIFLGTRFTPISLKGDGEERLPNNPLTIAQDIVTLQIDNIGNGGEQ